MKILNNFDVCSTTSTNTVNSERNKSGQSKIKYYQTEIYENKDKRKEISFGQYVLVKFRNKKWKLRDLPTEAGFEINRKCNANCDYCPNHNEPDRFSNALMEVDLFKKGLEDLKKLWGTAAEEGFRFPNQKNNKLHRPTLYFHFFGEPLLDERLESLIRIAKEILPNVKRKVFTNGIELNPERLKSLLDAGIDEIIVTRHTPNTTFMKNLISIDDKYLEKVYMKFPGEMALSNRGDAVDLGTKKILSDKKCSVPDKAITILRDGRLTICYDDYYRQIILGKTGLEKSKSIGDIWNSLGYKHIRRKLSKGDRDVTEICKNCSREDSAHSQRYKAIEIKNFLIESNMPLKNFESLINLKIPFKVIEQGNDAVVEYAQKNGITLTA